MQEKKKQKKALQHRVQRNRRKGGGGGGGGKGGVKSRVLSTATLTTDAEKTFMIQQKTKCAEKTVRKRQLTYIKAKIRKYFTEQACAVRLYKE